MSVVYKFKKYHQKLNIITKDVIMPSNLVKSAAKQTGKSVKSIEKKWDSAADIAKEQKPKLKEGSDAFYKYVTGIFKRMTGYKAMNESIMESYARLFK